MMEAPTIQSLLTPLSKDRLIRVARDFSVAVDLNATKSAQVNQLIGTGRVPFADLLRVLSRDELRATCRAHGLDHSGRSRAELAGRLLAAHAAGKDAGEATEPVPHPTGLFAGPGAHKDVPHEGDIVQLRHRQWMVEAITPPPEPDHATRVLLACLDDDNQGRQLEVLWELELGARVFNPEAHGLGEVARLDPPRRFGAYYHALKWNAVTSTDARLFQAPFRAGIQLQNHQMTPLLKALALPRANLFIADDVGLGKTIEAGLVLQELILRQQVDLILIVCPASVAVQWRDEMSKRFGLSFEIYNRAFVGRRRQERGFGVNPWSTYHRFIITYPTLRRPEYRDPLLQHLGDRARKSLLILDEAHTAAPATATKYAVDSAVTRVVRDVAPRFDHRLFLSATPHNGHSNSFSALLEILDPQRFTRGVPIEGPSELEPVMVRRLKEDLRELGIETFPKRRVVRWELRHRDGAWLARTDGEAARAIGPGDDAEIVLSEKLAKYTDLMKPEKARARFVFARLQQRLLSSVEAFARTLRRHEQTILRAEREAAEAAQAEAVQQALEAAGNQEESDYGVDDEEQEARDDAAAERSSRLVSRPSAQARQLLDEMLTLADQYRGAPDAKVRLLLDWIRRNQCPAAQIGGAEDDADPAWTDRRVIVFTEFGATKRYLWQILRAAIEGTERADERILQFHGGMSDDQRESVQRAFNGNPADHPVRILLATDAAREGVNLQAYCADLFHFDVPWNPARMEQRNGRIDRTLQPAGEVRCHYFCYPQRSEDRVLDTLVAKVETIRTELGSLGPVLMDRIDRVMTGGIQADTADTVDAVGRDEQGAATSKSELKSQRDDLAKLRREIETAGEVLNRSRQVMEFDPDLLRDAIDVGLDLVQPGLRLKPAPNGARRTDDRAADPGEDDPRAWLLPDLPESWQPTLDFLRPPRDREEPIWEWRKRPPEPVIFHPHPRLDSGRVHLHLQHPFVQRILSRFLAQGFSAHDLSRVTVLRNRRDSLVRAIAFGRLSLLGSGATRLHDELVAVAARWIESEGAKGLRPFADEADRRAIALFEQILSEAPALGAVPQAVEKRLAGAAPDVFAALWRHVRDEAESRAHDAAEKLAARGHEESEALRGILNRQRMLIHNTLEGWQLAFDFAAAEADQREQHEHDRRYMERRLEAIDREIETEPGAIEALFRVAVRRLEPVGLVFLWPETRG